MKGKFLFIIGVAILSIIAFVLSLFYFISNDDSLRYSVEKFIEKGLGQKQSVEIESIRVSPLLNVTARNFKITPREITTTRTPVSSSDVIDGFYCAETIEDVPFVISEVFVNPSIFSSLMGYPTGKYKLTIDENGYIEGEVVTSLKSEDEDSEEESAEEDSESPNARNARNTRAGRNVKNEDTEEENENDADSSKDSPKTKQMVVTAKAEEISLNTFSLLSNYAKMQIYGTLGFDINVVAESQQQAAESTNRKNARKKTSVSSSGKQTVNEVDANIKLSNTALCPKRIKLNISSVPYIDLPFTVLGNIQAEIEYRDGVLKIIRFASDGPDIMFDISGTIKLKTRKEQAKISSDPAININATITPSPEWVEANNMKMIYQLCRKQDDGSIKLTLTGTAKKPKHSCGTPIPEAPKAAPQKEPDKQETKPEKPNTQENEVEEVKKVTKIQTDDTAPEKPEGIREHSERTGVFRAPSLRNEDGGERIPERAMRPTQTRPRRVSGNANLDRMLEADAEAEAENRAIHKKFPPSVGRGRPEDNN